jgi:hypothetical protein
MGWRRRPEHRRALQRDDRLVFPTSTGPNVPAARQDASAEWTGSEVIIAPNPNGTSDYPGGRYDPSTDSWKPVAMGVNAPIAIYGRASVWTGTEMILWGGGGEGVGGRYNPSSDTWLAISTGTNSPQFRTDFSAVWTGSEMIVWGGGGVAFGGPTNTGGRYNPSTDTWESTSVGTNVASIRARHSAAWTGSEMIIWGGGHCHLQHGS